MMQTINLVALAAGAASTFWTATDPLVGKWSLDVSRSTVVDQMKIEAPGPGKYSFSFEGAPTETVIADGTDQAGGQGTTLAVKPGDARSLSVVRKQDGRIVIAANWTLSEDGRILRDAFTSLQPDGSSTTVDYVYKRISGSAGFAGMWESTTKPVGLQLELEIRPYDGRGLWFVSPGSDKKVIFDGKDHAVAGAKDGLTLSGRRRGAQAIDYAEKSGGKVQRARRFRLSSDGRSLTETLRAAGQQTPDILVFERE